MGAFGVEVADDFVCTCGAFSRFECICLWEYEDDNDQESDQAND